MYSAPLKEIVRKDFEIIWCKCTATFSENIL
jgi:hypothetical protein